MAPRSWDLLAEWRSTRGKCQKRFRLFFNTSGTQSAPSFVFDILLAMVSLDRGNGKWQKGKCRPNCNWIDLKPFHLALEAEFNESNVFGWIENCHLFSISHFTTFGQPCVLNAAKRTFKSYNASCWYASSDCKLAKMHCGNSNWFSQWGAFALSWVSIYWLFVTGV